MEASVEHDRNRHACTIQVLVADNSPFHTQLLVGALSREPDLKVFSSDLNAASVMAASIAHKIDVFVLSAFMDEDAERGFRILQELREADPHTRAVILLDSSKIEAVLQSFRAGARGVFDHRESPYTLCQCIRQVQGGQVWINNEQMALVLESLASSPKLKTVDAKGMTLLSKREADVVRCVAEGLTNHGIAERLGLSQHTIKNHLFRIFDKLGVSNRIELLFVTLSPTTPEDAALSPMPDPLSAASGTCDQESLALCEKAAEKGDLAAQLILARNSWTGRAGDHDPVRAYLWFSMSVDQLTRCKNDVKKAMNAAQREEAERLVREHLSKWQPIERPVAAQSLSHYELSVLA
jgi:two-component system nitrate/nitrite response regulator NarL